MKKIGLCVDRQGKIAPLYSEAGQYYRPNPGLKGSDVVGGPGLSEKPGKHELSFLFNQVHEVNGNTAEEKAKAYAEQVSTSLFISKDHVWALKVSSLMMKVFEDFMKRYNFYPRTDSKLPNLNLENKVTVTTGAWEKAMRIISDIAKQFGPKESIIIRCPQTKNAEYLSIEVPHQVELIITTGTGVVKEGPISEIKKIPLNDAARAYLEKYPNIPVTDRVAYPDKDRVKSMFSLSNVNIITRIMKDINRLAFLTWDVYDWRKSHADIRAFTPFQQLEFELGTDYPMRITMVNIYDKQSFLLAPRIDPDEERTWVKPKKPIESPKKFSDPHPYPVARPKTEKPSEVSK